MELRFEKKICKCLRRNVWEVQDQEQTQEVKLSDGMPDIGSILAAWGQCVMRGKEWLGDGMSVSGGVMAWVLYAPADGTEPRVVETWLPMKLRWSFAEAQREGTIRTSWLLKGVDARVLSARKMMVRGWAGVLGEAVEPQEVDIYGAEQVPEDVQLLRRTYPAQVPMEAGEKVFPIDEELRFPTGTVAPERLVSYSLTLHPAEQKVVGGKIVFRGSADLHLVYHGTDGQLHCCDMDAPYSQYADLDRDYDKEATAQIMMAVSSLEPEIQEGGIRLKCALVAQYLICDRMMLELVEDAYSPRRSVDVQTQELKIPMVLDTRRENLHCEAVVGTDAMRVVDAWVYPEHPTVRRTGDRTELGVSGNAQALYYDGNGDLRGGSVRWDDQREYPVGEDAVAQPQVRDVSRPQISAVGGQVGLRSDIQTETVTTGRQGIPMVTGITLGEMKRPDPNRPSLLLRRAEEGSLWELAKRSGSTVDAIRMANGLDDGPLDDRLLLIPVS